MMLLNDRRIFIVVTFLFSLVRVSGDTIEFFADSVSSSAAKGKERTSLDGNVSVTVSDRVISADTLEILGSDRSLLTGVGSISIVDEKDGLIINGEEFSYDRNRKIMKIRGGITTEDRKNDVLIRCGYIEYREETNRLLMQLNVRIFNKDIVTRSDFADYFRDDEVVQLTGGPSAYKGDDYYKASVISINLDTQTITLENRVTGEIITEEESEAEAGTG